MASFLPSTSPSPNHPALDASNGDRKGVSILWDLDNKPPKVSPYHAALHLRAIAAQFGRVVDKVACANKQAFTHIPKWVQQQQHQQQHSEDAAFNGKDARSRRRGSAGRQRAPLLYLGYGLGFELKRAGFSLRTVESKPQAADRALKKQIRSCILRGLHCICLVSDDSDFMDALTTARSHGLVTVVIGDTPSLQQFTDLWYPWEDVAEGKDVASLCVRGMPLSQAAGQKHRRGGDADIDFCDFGRDDHFSQLKGDDADLGL